MMSSDTHIRDVGGIADDSFVGHCDEVILTLKGSSSYLNPQQQT